MGNNNNNNNIAFVILGLFGFLVLLILSRFIIDNQQNNQRCDEHSCHQQTMPQNNLQQPPEYYVNPNSHYHSKDEFWQGYHDGYCLKLNPNMLNCPEYRRGYDIGVYDKRKNCKDYYDRYYQPGLNIRVPGFQFNLR